MGYRYNIGKGRVQKTGIIRVTSVPSGADIYLNGTKYGLSQTPARIEKLLPGDYEIKLSKDGFYDWQKKLPVYENGTTFAEKVILWKKSAASVISTTTADSWLVSPDKNIVAITDKLGSVSLLDINSGIFGETSGGSFETITSISSYDDLKLSSFSPSGRYIIAEAVKGGKTAYYLIDTLSKNNKKISSQDFINVKWEASSDNLYALDKTGLWTINLASLKPQISTKGLIASDFYVSNKSLYFIADGVLKRQALGENNSSAVEKLSCADCRIYGIKSNRLIALGAGGDMSIIDLNRQVKTINAKAKNIDWLNPNSMIFSNDYEIFIYEFAKSDPELITRLGSPITSAIWHPNGRHLIFSTDNKIKIIELDNRELRNIIEINDSAASFMTADRAGNNLYFSSASGINKLNLQ
jgi:hypothetical protein